MVLCNFSGIKMATDTQSQPMEVQGVITPALQLLSNQNNGKGGLEKLER